MLHLRGCAVVVCLVTVGLAAPVAAAKGRSGGEPGVADDAQTALNIIPSGQYGSVPPPPQAADQAVLYDGLTPLFGNVTASDLSKYFKSERLGTAGQGPMRAESPAPRGVRILRDGFDVPHIYGKSHDAVTFGAGWVIAEDRGLLLEQARYNARVAAIDAPGLDAVNLTVNLKNFEPSTQTEHELAKQTQVLLRAGAKGRAVLHDIDEFVAGINAYYRQVGNPARPWTRNDVYALDALKGQFVGQGGGDEAARSMFLSGLQAQLGSNKAQGVFNDLREANDPETPVSVPGSIPFQSPPRSTKGNVVLDNGSFTPTAPADPQNAAPPAAPLTSPAQASNVLMVSGARSANHHPLMVAGPQIGYYYPGFTLEMDLHGPGIDARGATSAPFPGYILIGRSEDYAWSLTSAGLDIIDTYVETLCGGSDTKYLYKGRCRDMATFDAGTLTGDSDQPVTFRRTVHGPVIGYATVHGQRVAVTRKRASYGRDALDLLLYRDLTVGNVHNVQDFFRAANQSPQTFNSFYIDDRDIGVFTSGRVPVRPPNVDPGLPIDGRGGHEWRGFLPFDRHPHGINPPDGQIVNWNNKTIAGYRAADDNWSLGPLQRVQLLTDNLGHRGSQTLASLTAAMNKTATQDMRAMEFEPILAAVLRTDPAPSPREEQMLQLLDDWRRRGGSRLDADLDGNIDDPGAAILDAAWPKLAQAWAGPELGPLTLQFASIVSPYSAPPQGQYDGWHIYMDKDLRTLLGRPVKGAYHTRYCGNGNLAACRDALWTAIQAAGDELTAAQGPDPANWHTDATHERITFKPGLLSFTMRYTNRPTGIQQLITFTSHRPNH
jgi:acyl-homoserine lactone acylase PvdQ